MRVIERCTKPDRAQLIEPLIDDRHPEAERIVLVQDNPNIHTPAALYAILPPDGVKRQIDKIAWHTTQSMVPG